MARQPRRTREQWIEIVEGYVQSDQTQQRYAHRRGVSVSSLQYWLKKLRDERFRKATSEMTMCSPVEFVEVFQTLKTGSRPPDDQPPQGVPWIGSAPSMGSPAAPMTRRGWITICVAIAVYISISIAIAVAVTVCGAIEEPLRNEVRDPTANQSSSHHGL